MNGDRMLTSTYALVSLSVEQTTVRAALHALVRDLHALPAEAGILVPGHAARLCAELRRVVDLCHTRKFNRFLVPALRGHTGAADGILKELEELSRTAAAALAAAEACVDAGRRGVDCGDFQDAVERCAAALRRRLESEEHELFPLARSVVGGEVWFAIAHQMLAHDACVREQRGDGRDGLDRREIFDDLAHGYALHAVERASFGFERHHAALSLH
jgi:hemerythrin-like domain-containing protein